jgi:hypothetical protein
MFHLGAITNFFRESLPIENDEESFGPQSLSYSDVNEPPPNEELASVEARLVADMGDIPKTQPAWLQQILDNHDRALNESKEATNKAFDDIRKEREEFLKKVDDVTTSFRNDFAVLESKHSETAQGLKSVQDEVNELKVSVEVHSTDISAVDQRVDDTKNELLAKIADLKAEFDAKLAGKATNPVRPLVPASTSIGEQCSIEREFDELLTKARSMANCFAMGRVTDAVVGYVSPPKTAQQVLDRYFGGLTFEFAQAPGKSQIKRLRVDKQSLQDFRANLEVYEFQIRSDGWWLVQDLPPDLRLLRSNAFKFFKEARSMYETVKATFLDVSLETGCVVIDGVEFVPIYLIPRVQKKWPVLFPIFQRAVEEVLGIEWVEKKSAVLSISHELLQEWSDAVGLKSQPVHDSDTEMHDALSEVQGGG